MHSRFAGITRRAAVVATAVSATVSAAVIATVIALALPLAAHAADAAAVDAALAAAEARAVELRHQVHQNPELSNRETETAALVAEELTRLGYEVETGVAHTGVVGVLRGGGGPGPVVAVRADMDALPVTEATDLPFASTKRTEFLGQEVGVAHACGHDVHVAVGLGTAAVLAELRDQLPGTVKFLFQPAEEGSPPGERGGASLMIEEGALADPAPEAIFALHSMPAPAGQIGWISGANMAAVDQFEIELQGKQAHGAAPELSVDPIVTGAQVVLALQTIASRSVPPLDPVVVTVGIFRGGERFNIIPGAVHLEGTVRTYDPEVRETVIRRMREILDGLTAAAGATYDLTYTSNAPATINDAELSARMRPVLVRAMGEANVVDAKPLLAGEDFAFFANEIPGFYFRLGVVAPGTESGGLHTPNFRADDTAIPAGMRAMTHVVLDYLEGGE